MSTSKVVPIAGYCGAVPNTFVRQEGEAEHLAVLLPGMGYTCDMPLFYYAENLLTERGADVLRVEYAYGRRADFGELSDDEQLRWLLADATAAYRVGLGQRAYRDVTLVGKSLGTLAMGHLLTAEERPAGTTRAVWLTPLVREERLREQMGRCDGRSLVVIGTADPHYDVELLDEVRAATRGGNRGDRGGGPRAGRAGSSGGVGRGCGSGGAGDGGVPGALVAARVMPTKDRSWPRGRSRTRPSAIGICG